MPLNNLMFVLFFMVVSLYLSDAGVCKYGKHCFIDCMIDVLMMCRVLMSSKKIQMYSVIFKLNRGEILPIFILNKNFKPQFIIVLHIFFYN